ncbi:hypothetical protein CHS0354_036457 [Potamilus streckersoni]|uniref:PH domain-containing protein n=1 Tax=Potamilus streckersoni TaxID=2493646 RepID=A0AAE0SWW2_9BIVA|nr:hypothetical protein CHS0354_036457 [Potamilus streckersoni]
MSFADQNCRPCGWLQIVEIDVQNASKKGYFVLDKMEGKLKCYMSSDDSDPAPTSIPKAVKANKDADFSINLKYISKVSDARKLKTKVENSFVINYAGKQCFLAARTEEDMTLWIEQLNDASKITVPKKEGGDDEKTGTYTAEIAGGVVVIVPNKDNKGSDSEESFEPKRSAESIPALMSGFCVKQGAVRKNWKRRFFVLNDSGFSYYKSEQEMSPIRLVPLSDISFAKTVDRSQHPTRDNLFEVITPKRTFYIQCDTPAESVKWVDAINKLVQGNKLLSNESEAETRPKLPGSADLQDEVRPYSKAVWFTENRSSTTAREGTGRPNQRMSERSGRQTNSSRSSSKRSWHLW